MDNIGPDIFGRREEKKEEFEIPAMSNAADIKVIGVGGGAGSLSEMANAWALQRLVVAYRTAEGWSSKLADTRLDTRIRYSDIPEDRVYGADTAEEALEIINKYIDRYDRYHLGITPNN